MSTAAAKAIADAATTSASASAKAAAEAAAAAAAKNARAAAVAAAETAAKNARKIAQEAAEASAAAAVKAAREGTPAAKAAAEAAAKSAEAAAKNADTLTKNADDLLKASDDVTTAGTKSSNTARKTAALLAAGGAVAGGLLFLDDKFRDADEKIKDCMKVCLPDNWDEHVYNGPLDTSALKYKELDDLGDQPVCTDKIGECAIFCDDKCTELHEYVAPGSNIVNKIVDTADDAAEGLFDRLNPFKGLGNVMGKVVFGIGIFLGVLLLFGLLYAMYKAST